MANYKKITDLELIEEVSESATVLAINNGTLKQVPYEMVGGGKSNCCVINIDQGNAEGPSENVDSDELIYSCNMTYSELLEALQNKTLIGFTVNAYAGTEMRMATPLSIYYGSDAPGIMILLDGDTLQFSSDDTIVRYNEEG